MTHATTSLPGDLPQAARLSRLLRVDHAGEYGAARIYAGQLAVLKNSPVAPVIRHMAEQEQKHLDTFNRLLPERGARPSALLPLWHIGGFALGAVTALLGEKAAMACTVAVEEVIDEHYAAQIAALPPEETELRQTLETFRAEEVEHRDTGLAQGAEDAPFYRALTHGIKRLSRTAIWLAERV